MADYRVNLDIFAGPLDLLLYLVRKEEVLLSIKDLEFDFKIGKVSEEDYADLRHRLEVEATSILEKLDTLEKEKKESRKDSKHVVV